MKRREFLLTAAAAATTLTLTSGKSALAAVTSHRPLGVQLFTVMAQLEADFDGTLKTLAEIGYREVETIGSFGRDPAELRATLDRHGLVTPSQHLMPDVLYKNFLAFTRREITAEQVGAAWNDHLSLKNLRPNVEDAIKKAKALGQQYVVLQIIWPDQMKSRELLDEFCKSLDMAGDLCAAAGLTFNFHNHSDEMKAVNGYVPYQVILESTNPKTVKMELDLYWAVHAKADPVELFRKNPGRYVQCHVKDSTASGDFATVGKGIIDFPRILPAALEHGVRHFYVEYDRADDPMAVVRDAYGYLAKLM